MSNDPGDVEAQITRFMNNFVAPQLRAEEIGVESAIVRLNNPDAPGFDVTCGGCGMSAKSPVDPGDNVPICPRCARKAGIL